MSFIKLATLAVPTSLAAYAISGNCPKQFATHNTHPDAVKSAGELIVPASAEDIAIRTALDLLAEVECPAAPNQQTESEQLEDLLDAGKLCIETVQDTIDEAYATTSAYGPQGENNYSFAM